MKIKLLVLAPFPNDNNSKDGMISRVNSIDNFFHDRERTYLYISLRNNWKKHIETQNNVQIYNLNVVKHLFEICNIILSANTIYIHSIHMIKHVFFMLLFMNPQKTILDAHGAGPEEEKYFKNRKLLYLFYSFVEKMVFKHVNTVICVTNAMKDHFSKKYPDYKGSYYIYSILPTNITDKPISEPIKRDENIYILYSGGISTWQKIDFMLDIIEKNQAPNLKYIILSGHMEEFSKKISRLKINKDNLIIDSVKPSELENYYKYADYGFILRDDNTVNNVANPTKLVEYLHNGMIPIVLTPNIGDYIKRGMEYLSIDDFNTEIQKPLHRSQKNIDIVKELKRENDLINFSFIVN